MVQKSEVNKKTLLGDLSKTREDFINLEREISKNFASFSLNEILELKNKLSKINKKIKEIAYLLRKKHKVNIDLEDRNNI